MEIRKYTSGDLYEILKLFGDTVCAVNVRDYSPEQIGAWVSNIDAQGWDSSLNAHYSLVAVIDGKIVGFGDMDASGYLDRLYVHADYQRRGIAAAICGRLEQYAASINANKIVTYASITAKPFFEKRGYVVVMEQQVERAGVLLTNYVMERNL